MKKIYTFTLSEEKEVETQKEGVDEKGNKTITIEKQKQNVPRNFFVAKPTRSLSEKAEFFNAVEYSKAVKAGMIPEVLIKKRAENDDGILSDKKEGEWVKFYIETQEKTLEYEKLLTEKEPTEEQKTKIAALKQEILNLRKKLSEIKITATSIYEKTPEIWARNRTIIWLMLYLSFEEDGRGGQNPVFGDGEYESRLRKYDELFDEESIFNTELINKLLLIIGILYVGGGATQKEIDEYLNADRV